MSGLISTFLYILPSYTVKNMYDRSEWTQIFIPKSTRREIRKIARTHDLKLWEVVEKSLQEFKSKQVTNT